MDKVHANLPALLFLDAPVGTGKTSLIILLPQIRQSRKVAVASSGIMATLLSDGRTVHSVFILPLNFS